MQNSMIAKLLAKENISVEHGNYRTAFFDVEKRVLGLPLWKDMGKDVYDLMVGHEVGHALFTPADGWHESTKEIPGVPRSYINIVEDVRIEKLIQRQYPGLVGSFKRGYKVFDDQDFFGIANVDINTLSLADRINVKAKLRDLIDVEFAANEEAVVKQVFAVETWEDVIEACRALREFVENKDNETTNESANSSEPTSDEDEMFDDAANDTDGSGESSGEDQPESESSNQPGSSSDDEESGSDSAEGAPAPSNEPVENSEDKEQDGTPAKGAGREFSDDDFEAVTDTAFRDREDELLDLDAHGRMKDVIDAVTRRQAEAMTIPYKQLLEMRAQVEVSGWAKQMFIESNAEEVYTKFNEDTKRFVALMAKEFEMRKAAYRSQRAQTSRSGSLDMAKLHSYKYNDDIFSRVTQLADAKSHGMILFVDYSGSMGGVLNDVVKQTLTLAEFCKKVGIPFDVYTFTSGSAAERIKTEPGQIEVDGAQIVQVLSSKMTKSEYVKARRDLFMISFLGRYNYGASDADGMGGTPLNEVVMASRFIIRDFKRTYNVQKTNVIFLTDGDAQGMYIRRKDGDFRSAGTLVNMDGKMIDIGNGYSRSITESLFNEIRKECTLIGYFIADGTYAFRGKLWQVAESYVTDEAFKEARKTYNKQKFLSYDNVIGYDKFFILKGEKGSLNTDDDDFEVSENANKGEITRAFKKHANSKKANKVLATQFAKMVA